MPPIPVDRDNSGGGPQVRPGLHFIPTRGLANHLGDVRWDGSRYHLYFEMTPNQTVRSVGRGRAHATSADLVRWREQGLVDERPATLAAPLDDLVVPAPFAASLCDPHVWAEATEQKMIVGAGAADGSGAVLLYRSADELSWQHLGVLCQGLADPSRPSGGAESWGCPRMSPIGNFWLLVVSVRKGGRADHVAAAVGHFDGATFVHQGWRRLIYGPIAYATTLFSDSAGRVCMISLLRQAAEDDSVSMPWAGAYSVVAQLSVDSAGRLQTAPHPNLDAFDIAAARNDFARLRIETTGPQQVQVSQLGQLVRVERAADSGVVTLHRPGCPPELLPPGSSATGVEVLLDSDIIEIFNNGTCGSWRLRPHPPVDIVQTVSTRHAEVSQFRVETSDLDEAVPRSSSRLAPPGSMSNIVSSIARRRLIWLALAAAVLAAVGLVHATRQRTRPTPAVAISPVASPVEGGYRPPSRIRACPGNLNCLTTQSVPPSLISSISAHFPGAAVTCAASSFDGTVDEVTVQQVCLTSRSGELLLITEERIGDTPSADATANAEQVGPGQSLVVRGRAGWVLSVMVTDPNSRAPDGADIDAAIAWTGDVALPA